MSSIRVGQITDLHLRHELWGAPPILERRSRAMRDLLPLALEQFRRSKVDAIAVTGDLLDVPNPVLRRDTYYDYGTEEWLQAAQSDYRLIKDQLDARGIPYIVLPGNHDDAETFWKVFPRAENTLEIKGRLLTRFCDAETDGHVPRRLGRERKLWESSLREGPPGQIHLQHYVVTPCLNEGYPHTYLKGDDIASRNARSGRVPLSLSGHYHAGTELIHAAGGNSSLGTVFATGKAFCVFPHTVRLFDIGEQNTVEMEEIPLCSTPVGAGRKVIFLDRDGVINTLASYSTGPEEMELIPGAAKSIARLHQSGYAVVVVSNQSCVGAGNVLRDTVDAVNERMGMLLRREGGREAEVDCVLYSTGAGKDACAPCFADPSEAKPRTVLFERAIETLKLSRGGAWMVGDRAGDLKAAENLGIRGILVRTGEGKKTYARLRAEGKPEPLVADHLEHAVERILRTDDTAISIGRDR